MDDRRCVIEPNIPGLRYSFPESFSGSSAKAISCVEVGPVFLPDKAAELSAFLHIDVQALARVDSYILVHPNTLSRLEGLLRGKPFVDPILHQATMNSSLAERLGLDYTHVFHAMLQPGTSDAFGNVALDQALLSFGMKRNQGDAGFYSALYFLKGNLSRQDLDRLASSALLANPELCAINTWTRDEYRAGISLPAPIVELKNDAPVEYFDVANMSLKDLTALNEKHEWAASPEELEQFREMYRDSDFIARRRKVGLDGRAVDVEPTLWFGDRSEHCFHKEFNAHITLEDTVNDPVFDRAFRQGYLKKDSEGRYVIEDGIFKTFIRRPAERLFEKLEKRGKNWIESMFEDNSGVVLYDEDFAFCIKCESHNSPGNKEPVEGAKTGIDGVNRDVLGTEDGTFDPIANYFFFCTGKPEYIGWLPKDAKHPYVLLKGITRGVREGGNESQIPTLGGGVITCPGYIGKILLICGTVGWSPTKDADGISFLKPKPAVGDYVYVVGQAVGIDGFGGATVSSLSASKDISLGHVQADFAFEQVKMKEYILDIARRHMISAITDMGAMGLGSSSTEMAARLAPGGLLLDLAKHPTKYAGIRPKHIIGSETQDRMLITSRPEGELALIEASRLYETNVTRLGSLTDSGYIHLTYGDKTVCYLDIKKLFDKNPRKQMKAVWRGSETSPEKKISVREEYSLSQSLCMVMAEQDVSSKEWFLRQMDSSVKGATIQGPLIGERQEVNADAAIQKPLDTEGRDYGAIATAHGICPKLSYYDPYLSAQRSLMDMIGKIIAVGGALPDMENPKWDAWAVCGNYFQPNSESRTTLTKEVGEHNLASLVREAYAAAEVTDNLNVAVISGKDSMKCSGIYEVGKDFSLNDLPPDLRRYAVIAEKGGKKWVELHDPDTYFASCAVKIDDYRKTVNSAFKQDGDIIYVIGMTGDDMAESQWASAAGYAEDKMPKAGGTYRPVDFTEFKKTAEAVNEAILNERVASCAYVHAGGIAAAVAKGALAGETGASLDAKAISTDSSCSNDYERLFSETQGRFVMTVAPGDRGEFERILSSKGVKYSEIGMVSKATQDGNGGVQNQSANEFRLRASSGQTDTLSMDKLREVYLAPLDLSKAKN